MPKNAGGFSFEGLIISFDAYASMSLGGVAASASGQEVFSVARGKVSHECKKR